jgi:glycine/D-amino acid oxidase-like deaminating enzyme
MSGESFYARDVKLEPYWWEDVPRIDPPAVEVPGRADVVVVGSGYAGLSAALTLAAAGREVVVLEAERIGFGASTRNGGAVGTNLRISFARMIEMFGLERATACYREVRSGRDYLEGLIDRLGIDCGYARVGRFIGAHKPGDYQTLARDLEAQARHLGFEAEMIPRERQHGVIGTDDYHGGRLIHSDGNLHPARLHQGLLDGARAAGAVVVGRTRVRGIETVPGGFHVQTSDPRRPSLPARDVVVATNAYTGSESPWLRRRLIPIQSQIIATAPLSSEVIERLVPNGRQFGDTCRLHFYYRPSPDRTRILFGGRAGGSELNDPARSGVHLHRKLVSLFPELKQVEITHSWAGMIAYTFDSLPHMTRHDGIHHVAGFCGSGVAMATWLGHRTAERVLCVDGPPCAFDSEHPTYPLYTGNPWFMPAMLWYFGLRDRYRI